MIRIVINKRHGGFGLSSAALLYLFDKKSPLIMEQTFDEFGYTKDELDAEFYVYYQITPLTNGLMKDRFGNLLDFEKMKVYSIGLDDLSTDSIKIRSHPDLIDVVETLGDEADDKYAKLKIVEINDDNITLDDIQIAEYDGSEWVEEKHRVWS
jgi:hypothetical protein